MKGELALQLKVDSLKRGEQHDEHDTKKLSTKPVDNSVEKPSKTAITYASASGLSPCVKYDHYIKQIKNNELQKALFRSIFLRPCPAEQTQGVHKSKLLF
ncbi:MAG: hypothetical protein D4R70_01940 [Betaproteobacteria bacterium]|nr:MAG: hypothetical protein D4R70_01940 [Betaproteobacteria bacterium]